MSHEVSNTNASPLGGFWNVSGHTGTPLPQSFGFEHLTYPNLRMAVMLAQARSGMFGQLIDAINSQPQQGIRLGLPVPYAGTPTPYEQVHATQHSDRPGLPANLIRPPRFNY